MFSGSTFMMFSEMRSVFRSSGRFTSYTSSSVDVARSSNLNR